MERVEDVLPDVEGGVGVSEGQDDVVVVDGQHAFDVLEGFFDVVGMDGFVGIITNCADPVDEVLCSPDNEGVGEQHLVDVVQGEREDGEDREDHEFDRRHQIIMIMS